jgi:hypothetical protein
MLHDDLMVSAALSAVLHGEKWGATASEVITGIDPLAGLGDRF